MIILDYIKRTEGSLILVPPFHTGHLGFVPDTEVRIHLMAPHTLGATNCEVVITPYESKIDNIMQLSCTMEDRPGVVDLLVDVIAEFGINIVSLETSGINYLNHHRVNMLLDWSTSHKYPRDTPSNQKVQREFRDYQLNFPINIQRYVALFERIIENCGGVLVWEEVTGIRLPMINLRPITSPAHLHHFGVVTIQPHPKKPLHAQIELPKPLFSRLNAKLQTNSNALHYILLSETETRTLRVLFPRPDIIPRVVHIGFYHLDIPGALSVILGPLARANFNILTSLLRQNKDSRNVLEAVLEYRGEDKVPFSQDELHSPEAGEELCRWAAGKMRENLQADEVEGIRNCELQIGLPRYPRRKNAWDERISFRDLLKDGPAAGPKSQERGRTPRRAGDSGLLSGADAPEKMRLIASIQRRRENANPSIFLSYPRVARDHAALLKKRLQDRYHLVEYQEPDAEMITEQVVQKIVNCDYFIAIWHHEDESGNTISPWLPFEYGVALTARKKSIVVHSQKLNQKIWKRINPGIAQPEYSDVKFESETVPLVDQYCKDHFVEDYQPLQSVYFKSH